MLHSISGTMSHNAYKNYDKERGAGASSDQDCSVGMDPASGMFFSSDYKRHEDLKEMLDSNKDNLKLEAMKRIIGMIAKGRDASALFPAVVKNVVSKNVELKKLVYSYLERYAEEKEDLALLSISTFQRALKEPNQLIRAGALRVLSGVRVPVISPIVMIAIKDAAADMSPYVRKTAAHAIPKLHDLNPHTKPDLIEIIEKLLADRTVLVIGSAVMAFTQVCPERVDLIHKVFRKLCALLGDVDEWGQVVIVNVLTRYARTQFLDPSINEKEEADGQPFYESESDWDAEKEKPSLDPDHRLLLRSARPLLQSRNAAVVMAVAQLYYHTGPKVETGPAIKALVRLLRSYPEVQELVLMSIVSMTITKKKAFDVYVKSFFVRTTDSLRVKLLKLTILTNIANESNIPVILRELETYISSYDDDFVAATIQAIGRCACFITAVTDTCLSGLVTLLSNKNEVVVAESVVVIKRLLQTQAVNPKDIIQQMIRLLDNIDVPQARASIIWLLGEHCRDIPSASNVLKKAAKSFASEENIVKLQVLNLAVKLHIWNKKEYELLCQYIFNLAKYDQNYDIRDRARLLRCFVEEGENPLVASAAKIFLQTKPAPTYRTHEEVDQYQLGSLSHSITAKANGYEPLPSWPEVQPPTDVRDVEPIPMPDPTTNQTEKENKSFDSWESESSSSESFEADTGAAASGSEETESASEDETESSDNKEKTSNNEEESSSNEDEDDDEEEESSSESEEEKEVVQLPKTAKEKQKPTVTKVEPKEKSNLDLLLNLDMTDSYAPILTPSMGGFLTPGLPTLVQQKPGSGIEVVRPYEVPAVSHEALNRISGNGLGITYRFTRNPHLFSPNMVNINLIFSNANSDDITDIKLGQKNLSPGITVHEFACITSLGTNNSLPGTLGIDFNDSLHAANMEIVSSVGSANICITPRVGELMRPVRMGDDVFTKEQMKLKGMNEHVATVPAVAGYTPSKVYQAANLGPCSIGDSKLQRYAGQTLSSSSLILVTVAQKENEITITVNCEKLVIGSMLLNELKTVLQS